MTRGEIVLVVAGAPCSEDEDAAALAAASTLRVLLQELPVSQAARIAAQLTGRSRKELYERALALTPPKPGE
jgi:16S rRNA (cytidine1402-2'-O)-methyltransferase